MGGIGFDGEGFEKRRMPPPFTMGNPAVTTAGIYKNWLLVLIKSIDQEQN